MPSKRNYGAMTVKELRTCIERAGFEHDDCVEVSELRQRAKEADAAKASGDFGNLPVAAAKSKAGKESAGTLRQRNAAAGIVMTIEEKTMLDKVNDLVGESSKVRGRDASVILEDAEKFKEQIAEATHSPAAKKLMTEALEEVNKNLAFETHLEKHCARFIQIGLLAVTIIPVLLTLLESFIEYSTRPVMEVLPVDLHKMNAVVTGGCGATGLELATMLANSGAGVVISCHGNEAHKADKVESHLAKLGLLHGRNGLDKSSRNRGWIEVWPLELESFVSVRKFAARVSKEVGTVDILVHNAATKEGCVRTVDGFEQVTQVNFLSPFLLTHLLLPVMQGDSARVVHVACDAGLQQPDWLPWPLRRTQPELLPRVDFEAFKKRAEGAEPHSIAGECNPLLEYANSKLSVVVQSHELNRQITNFVTRGVSQVVNPGAMDSAFGRTASSAAPKPSMRSSMMGYFPPAFIAQKIYSVTLGPMFAGMSTGTFRTTSVGAKALFHVATSAALGEEENGGGLFADTAGAFTECGKPAGECGRVPQHKQPAAAFDEELAAELWERTKNAIGYRNLQPLRDEDVVQESATTVTGESPSTVTVEPEAMVSEPEPVASTDGTREEQSQWEPVPDRNKPPMTVKFSREEHGTHQISFNADGTMRELFDHYRKQVGGDAHFTIWGQDVDLEKTVAETWDLLQLDKDDAIDVRNAD